MSFIRGDALRFNRPDHMFTEEIELGLPARFGIAIENSIEGFRGTGEIVVSVSKRAMLSPTGTKIPLNPTIFAEWKFGIGDILHDEGPPEPMGKGEAQDFLNERNSLPDAYANSVASFGRVFRQTGMGPQCILRAGSHWRSRSRIWFAQSVTIPVLLPNERLKVGAEMQLTGFTDKGIRGDPSWRFHRRAHHWLETDEPAPVWIFRP
mgnify:CR=1 FL=1